jgi:hypothetical protein
MIYLKARPANQWPYFLTYLSGNVKTNNDKSETYGSSSSQSVAFFLTYLSGNVKSNNDKA